MLRGSRSCFARVTMTTSKPYLSWADVDSWAARSPRPPQPMTLSALREWYLPLTNALDGVEFVVEVDGEVIGRCGMFNEDPLARHAEVGLALAASARSRGHGSDAMRVLVGFLFSARNLHRLHLESLADNAAALASYRNVGFVEEGVLRGHAFANGKYVDTVVMDCSAASGRDDATPGAALTQAALARRRRLTSQADAAVG